MHLRFLKLLILSCFTLCSCQNKDSHATKRIIIIPEPFSVEYKSDNGFKLDSFLLIRTDKDLTKEADLLAGYLSEVGIKSKVEIGENKKGAIFLNKGIGPDSSEAYRFICKKDGIQIFAPSRFGILHGIQSLRQILLREYQGEEIQLPAFEINDAPKFSWRGMLLDCCRHFMDKEFVKRYIDLLALHKMNRFHWHLTEDQGWRIEIKKYPKLTENGAWRSDSNGKKYGGFYTQVDIKEIIAFAEERGVMVIPEIELPGHAQAALASYPKYSCTGGPFDVETEWGVFKEIYCAGNEETFQFLENVLSEVINLFPSQYIHIGGDEVPKYRWENCSKCQKRIKDEGLKDEHELQSYFIGRINKFLRSKGKTIIGWDEILEGGLPEGAIVQSWRGFEGAKHALELGHPTIVSPTSHAYFDYGLNDIDLKKVYEFNPIPKDISKKEKSLVLGGECNMWTERAPQETIDSKVFPRILAMSEVLWKAPQKRDFEKFNKRVAAYYECLDRLGVKYGMETIPVQIETEVNNGALKTVLKLKDNSLKPYYRLGSGEKTEYVKPIEISQKDTVTVSFKRGESDIDFRLSQVLQPHLAIGKKIETAYEISPQYNGKVNDGKRGSSNFKDGCWQGTFGNNIEALIDLGELKEIKKVSAGFLQYNNAWIFLPKEIEVFTSTDGNSFTSAGKGKNYISPKEKTELTAELSVRTDIKTRFIKIIVSSIGPCPDWHDAAGSKSWLFMDEIVVE